MCTPPSDAELYCCRYEVEVDFLQCRPMPCVGMKNKRIGNVRNDCFVQIKFTSSENCCRRILYMDLLRDSVSLRTDGISPKLVAYKSDKNVA